MSSALILSMCVTILGKVMREIVFNKYGTQHIREV